MFMIGLILSKRCLGLAGADSGEAAKDGFCAVAEDDL